MPKVRNITVAVTPELYRQTRHIAAESDTTVTELVRFILIHLPKLLRRTNHPAADWTGIPERPSPPAAAAPSAPPAPPAVSASQPAAPVSQPAAPRSPSAAPLANRSASRRRAALLRQVRRL